VDGISVGALRYYRGRVWFGLGTGSGTQGVWTATAGSRAFPGGAAVTGRIVTSALESRHSFRPLTLEAVAIAQGEQSFVLQARTDRALSWTSQSEGTLYMRQSQHTPDVWGTGRWSSSSDPTYWGDYEPARIRVSLLLDEGFSHQLRIQGTELAFRQLELSVVPGVYSPRPFEPRS
jgi:hypothetical protein